MHLALKRVKLSQIIKLTTIHVRRCFHTHFHFLFLPLSCFFAFEFQCCNALFKFPPIFFLKSVIFEAMKLCSPVCVGYKTRFASEAPFRRFQNSWWDFFPRREIICWIFGRCLPADFQTLYISPSKGTPGEMVSILIFLPIKMFH